MRPARMLGAILGVAIAVLGVPGTAIAGGGCHGGVTEQDAREEDEATVRMIDACFQATLTTVDPGTPVTFVNDDVGLTHNLGGNGWGHFEDMIEGDTFRATFDAPGIYPFACNYHPGMTGAIVVGDGTGAGNGEDVTVLPFEPVTDTAQASGSSPVENRDGGAGLGLVAIIVLAIVGGAALGASASSMSRVRLQRRSGG